MGFREDGALGGKKRSEQILILLSLGELGTYLRLIQTWGALLKFPINSLTHSSQMSEFIQLFFVLDMG